MATRQQVLDFIADRYGVKPSSNGIFTFVCTIPNGREHKVYAAVAQEALQVTAPFVWGNRVNAETVLGANTYMYGIVEINGAYALKHNAFIEDLDESEIHRAIVELASCADEFESRLGFDDEF